jgi:hypothetical protein
VPIKRPDGYSQLQPHSASKAKGKEAGVSRKVMKGFLIIWVKTKTIDCLIPDD